MREVRQLVSGGQPATELQPLSNSSAAVAPPSYGTYGVETGEESGAHLLDYWRIVRKRLPLVIGVCAVTTVLAIIYNARKPDIFQAAAQVQVNLENDQRFASSKSGAVVIANPGNDPTYFNTQLQNLTRADLLRRVVKRLDLEHNPNFLGEKQTRSTWDSVLHLIGLSSRDAKSDNDTVKSSPTLAPLSSVWVSDDPSELKKLEPFVSKLQNDLRVEPIKDPRQTFKDTRLIEIRYTHTDPKLASDIVNAVAETFAAMNLESKEENTGQTAKFLGKRIADLQSQIREKEEKLQSYARNREILSPDGGTQDVVTARLVALNTQLVEAENARKAAEAELIAAQQRGAVEARVETGDKSGTSALLSELRGKLSEKETKKAQLLTEMTEENPEVKEVENEINTIKNQIASIRTTAQNSTLTNLKAKYEQAQKLENSLRAAFNEQRGKVLTQNEAAIQYRLLKSEIETSQQQLNSLMEKAKDNDVISAGLTNNIQVVDHALPPDRPVGPQRARNVLLTALFSLALGIGLALFLEYLDNTVRSVEDVEKNLRLPLLAMIPTANELTGRRRLLTASSSSHTPSTALIGVDSRSPIAEAYRQLRTSVMLSTAGRAPRTLLVTSSVPAEGKTTMSVNIAKSFAQTGARVLIIDADMRRPRQHAIFGIGNRAGLSTYLSSEMSEEELFKIIKTHEESGLSILPSGSVPPNPAELLGSEQMRTLLAILEKKYTHIVIDSPPIASFTDGVLLSTIVDGVLLVVHSGKTPRETVKRSRQLLQDVGARVFGIVLNNVSLRANNYYYQSYYRSYYTPATEEDDATELPSAASPTSPK
jgi:succinoglycan biosynthesis transport protein ExoP